jgi:choline dehydrogenase
VSRYDVLVLGGGTAGCVLAARLSEDPDRSVCLVEAGPDYGPYAEGRWPEDMLDARSLPMSHLWERETDDRSSSRARIVGGCSAHNACVVAWGSRADYDAWGEAWTFSALEPSLRRAEDMLRVRRDRAGELTPWHEGLLGAAAKLGLPLLDDANDLDARDGAAPFPLNALDTVRWNTAFAYLDEARARPNLTILSDTLVAAVALEGDRAVGADTDGGRLLGATTILAAGAYGSPLVLLRSGIGPADELAALAIEPIADLPVGRGLSDHPGLGLEWLPAPGLVLPEGPFYQASVLIRGCSTTCPDDTWDLQYLPWLSRHEDGTWEASMVAYLLDPRSRGQVRLRSQDPRVAPSIDHGFLRDHRDLARLLDGVVLGRRLAESAGAGPEVRPGSDADLEAYALANVRGIFHPTGTCAMGSVVDDHCRVLGIDDLYVADASAIPTIPRANTNLSTVALAERLVELLWL